MPGYVLFVKVVYVCINHFQKDDIDYTFKVPKGDGTFNEVPRAKPKLKENPVQSLLPGCPAYYSTKPTKRTRLSYDAKEGDFMNQTLQLSLRSESEAREKFVINSLLDLKDKLTLISLPNSWLVWFRNENNVTFVLAKMAARNISVDLYLEINAYSSTSANFNGQSISVPIATINDIRQIESILQELASEYDS